MRINKITSYGVGLLSLGLLSGSAVAQTLSCGETIGPGAIHVLTGDVGPCDGEDTALTLVGPTVLLMNGFSVFCGDLDMDEEVPIGIVMTERGALVFDGTVTGCDDGVGVNGEGNHILKELHTFGNIDDGFDIESDFNTFLDSSAHDNGDNGFAVNGNSNSLVDNASNGNEDRGFEVDGNNNFIVGNQAQDNQGDGIRLDDGTVTLVVGNAMVNNADDGIEINSSGNFVAGNEVLTNGEDGIQLSEGAENNTVLANTALGNNTGAVEDTFDLEDQNPDCDNNLWAGNSFDTSNQLCIQ